MLPMADAVHHRKMGYDAGRIMEMGNYLVWGFHGDSDECGGTERPHLDSETH